VVSLAIFVLMPSIFRYSEFRDACYSAGKGFFYRYLPFWRVGNSWEGNPLSMLLSNQ
jgi:hypothetical protein